MPTAEAQVHPYRGKVTPWGTTTVTEWIVSFETPAGIQTSCSMSDFEQARRLAAEWMASALREFD